MKHPNYKVDLQTIKITIAIFVCVLFYTIIGNKNEPNAMMIACTTAIFGIRSKTVDAWIFARYRILGTAIGCVISTIYLLIQQHFSSDTWAHLILIPTFTFITIIVCGGIKNPITVNGALMTLVIMTLLISPTNDKYYVSERIFATFIGVLVSVLVNWLVRPKEEHLFKDLKNSIEIEKEEKEEEKD